MSRANPNRKVTDHSLAHRIKPILRPFIKKNIVRNVYHGRPISRKATVVIARGNIRHSSEVVEALTQNGYKVTIESMPLNSRMHAPNYKGGRYHARPRTRLPIHGFLYLVVTAPNEPDDAPPFFPPKPNNDN